LRTYNAGDRAHVRNQHNDGIFYYKAKVIARDESIADPAKPYYLVTRCRYPLPGTSIYDPILE
jgi:hypothetical protein